ncbi:ABC-type transport auxiliary lipoprotein family protein [Consotaella salsifontis]|uniref:Cholesterol transport system auxiliary component n=1 Tax=Consotaella salsifontis TaxID=1365950 RepID=A0A1T4P702_9HYPH|nr:ABC-type transport auxiliary lipoprotein family protein [Consotaella salsifontis]SJZ87284.1 cholesterol transport system auxiliary component [Consotaella salsifontis]
MRMVRPTVIVALSLALGACAVLSPAPTPPDTYEISSPKAVTATARASRTQILIAEPTALRTLDGDKIVVKTSPYTVEYLADSQWSDRLTHMVQLRTMQAFENSGRVGAVGVPGQGLAIDYQVVMEIRRFEIAVYEGNRAVVEISVKALNDRNGTVRGTRIFTASQPVAGSSNADRIAALDKAFDEVSSEIVAWTLQRI